MKPIYLENTASDIGKTCILNFANRHLIVLVYKILSVTFRFSFFRPWSNYMISQSLWMTNIVATLPISCLLWYQPLEITSVVKQFHLKTALGNQTITVVVTVGLSKAFDTILHLLLVNEKENYGLLTKIVQMLMLVSESEY